MGVAQQRRGTIAGSLRRTYSQQVLLDSPLFYWRLAEASGTTCNDSSGNSRTGTYSATGLTYAQTGAVAGNDAILFNGTAGRIQTAATLDLSAFSAITIEIWMKVAAFDTADDLLIESSANAGSNNGAFFVDPNASDGKIQCMAKAAAGNNRWTFPRPSTGVYHHYVFICRTAQNQAWTSRVDKVDQTMTIFGAENNQLSAFGNFTVNVASRNATSLFLAATLDEIAIYGSALSTARTDAHFDAAAI